MTYIRAVERVRELNGVVLSSGHVQLLLSYSLRAYEVLLLSEDGKRRNQNLRVAVRDTIESKTALDQTSSKQRVAVRHVQDGEVADSACLASPCEGVVTLIDYISQN